MQEHDPRSILWSSWANQGKCIYKRIKCYETGRPESFPDWRGQKAPRRQDVQAFQNSILHTSPRPPPHTILSLHSSSSPLSWTTSRRSHRYWNEAYTRCESGNTRHGKTPQSPLPCLLHESSDTSKDNMKQKINKPSLRPHSNFSSYSRCGSSRHLDDNKVDKYYKGKREAKVVQVVNTHFTAAFDLNNCLLQMQSQKYNSHISDKIA